MKQLRNPRLSRKFRSKGLSFDQTEIDLDFEKKIKLPTSSFFFLVGAFQKLVFSRPAEKRFRRVSQVKAEADNLLGMLRSPLMMIFTPRD